MPRNTRVEIPSEIYSNQQLLEGGFLGRKSVPLDKALQNGIWVMTGFCNSECPYCIRSNKSGHEATEVTNAVIQSLADFPGIWRLSLTGGEVTQIPGFFQKIMPRIINDTPHLFSISTNLTASQKEYEQLMAQGRKRFERLSASFHYSIWPDNVDEFLKRVYELHIASEEYGLGKFNVACVLAPNVLKTILEKVDPFVRQHGIPIYYQTLKVPDANGLPVPFKYSPEQIKLLDKIIGQRNRVQALNPGFSFTGRQCKAGVSALLIEPNGDAFTCFDHMEIRDPRGYLGNVIKDGPAVLRDRLVVCAAPFCNVGSTVIDRVIDDPNLAIPDSAKRGQADSMAITQSSSPLINGGGKIVYQQDLQQYLAS